MKNKRRLKVILLLLVVFFCLALFVYQPSLTIITGIITSVYHFVAGFLRSGYSYARWDFTRFVFLAGIVVMVLTDSFIIPLAFRHFRRDINSSKTQVERWPSISILVPAYNEEVNIARTIESVYATEYPGDKEIIVINDGSTDRTAEIADSYVQRNMIELVNRVNGGKTSAINTGLVSARGEIIVVIDGDSFIKEDTLIELIKKMQSPEVGAVAGNIKVVNRINFISRLQHLEYIREINLPRRAFNVLDCVMVVPGPLGAFRREVLRSVGTYDDDTKTEDFDLTIKILKAKKYRVEVSQSAVSYTESPVTWKDLYKQRMRWYGGMLSTLRKHKDILGFRRSRYGNLGRIGGLYTLFTLIITPLMELYVYFILILTLLRTLLEGGAATTLGHFAIIFAPFLVLEILFSLVTLLMEKEKLIHGIWSLALIFPYRPFLDIIKLIALVKVIFLKQDISWNQVTRTGMIHMDA